MPRYLTTSSVKRRKATRDGYYTPNVFSWIDPFPEVHGTVPEKMVYAELTRNGIPFLFLNDIHFQIPEIELDKTYQADFVIPSLKLIIEVQGAYWHSKPDAIESDAFKFAVYEATGYKVLAWWDYDIIAGVDDLFLQEPLLVANMRLNNSNPSTELPVISRVKQDTSKGIRTLNSRRFHQKELKVGKRSVRKAIGVF